MNLNIDKKLFDNFLTNKQKNLENPESMRLKNKYEACIELKNALETSINKMIANNTNECYMNVDLKEMVDFKVCGLDKDINEFKNIVTQKTKLKFDVSIVDVQPYFYPEFFHTTIRTELNKN